MALISWNDSYSVSVAVFDQQHQKLVSMLNELSDAMKQGKGKDVVGGTINGLIRYTQEHFKKEEMYFEKFDYADKAIHKQEHAAFIKKVSAFKADFDDGKSSITIDILKFLSDWLLNHIKSTDKKYSAFFNENGLR